MPLRAHSGRTPIRALLRGLPGVLLAVGLIARLAPLLDPAGRGLRQFPTEDGYLMLTIARNIALGRGMSIAEGTIPTNGTQPLMAWLYAALFWVVGGDRVWGVWLAQLLQVALVLVACFLLFGVAHRMLKGQPESERVAALTAALWFASPLAVRHAQNCLETGPYVLTCLGVAAYVLRLPSGRPWPLGRCFLLGLLLALAFWVRNDASLLVGAICLARLLPALGQGPGAVWRRGLEVAVLGATALAGALPWLVHNKVRFGYVMPISGVSEGRGAELGQSLIDLPAAIAEYILLLTPIPESLEHHPVILVGSVFVIALGLFGAWRLAARLDAASRFWFAVVGLWLLLFALFYGFRFGVGFFVTRYFFPLSPFLALVSVYWAFQAWQVLPGPRLRAIAVAALLVLVTSLDVRLYLRGSRHQHFQVVEWIERNVAKDVWVGAIQTGTLGFFHERTINLDGKVNPYALAARLEKRTQAYVLESPIEYLADWTGIAQWLERTELRGRFELVVLDDKANLAVLRRIDTGRPSPPS